MRKFSKNELFCSKCLIHDSLFERGGSWTPDCCPVCGGTACILYCNLTFLQKIKLILGNKHGGD